MLSDNLKRRSPTEVSVMVGIFVFFLLISVSLLPKAPEDLHTNFCPQPGSAPLPEGYLPSHHFLEDSDYFEFSLQAMQGAVRVATESFDDMALNPTQDPTLDPRFRKFEQLHAHLAEYFPLTWKFVEKINTYGLLFTINGSNPLAKPIVLMAHQDVVPANPETFDEWTYPPFDAHFDGEWLYGRGSADTKNTLVSILEAVESLLSQHWQPQRTLLISFGFDEEIGGFRGAGPLSTELVNRYGSDSMELIVDEGFGAPLMYGSRIGMIMVGEKGSLNAKISVNTPGGHSSVPPDHTAIGIASELVRELEAHPFGPSLDDSNPTLFMYRCIAEHSPHMPRELRRTVLDIDDPDHDHRSELIALIESKRDQKYLIRTSQAVDIIQGGVKVNALPEQVDVTVNHRIALDSSGTAVVERIENYVEEVARRHGLGAISEGETLLDPTSLGLFNITLSHPFLEPAPLAPTSGVGWDLIAGTTLSVLSSQVSGDSNVVVAPSIFTANTDTRHYWDLTRAIYRFTPSLAEDLVNYHTVDERLRFRSHLMAVAWFYEFILGGTL